MGDNFGHREDAMESKLLSKAKDIHSKALTAIPSLKFECLVSMADLVLRSVQNANSEDDSPLWSRSSWIEAKQYVQHLPKPCLQELSDFLFDWGAVSPSKAVAKAATFIATKRSNQVCNVLLKKLDLLSYNQGAFMAWWLMLDEEYDKVIRFPKFTVASDFAKFNEKLLQLLQAKTLPKINTCGFTYNWILASYYATVLSTNLPNLEHVVFHQSNLTNQMLDIFATHAKGLKSLVLESPSGAVKAAEDRLKGSLTTEGVVNMLTKLKQLEKVDLILLDLNDESEQSMSSVFQCLRTLDHLRTLLIGSKWIAFAGKNDLILPQVESVTLSLIYHPETFDRAEFYRIFPNLKTLHLFARFYEGSAIQSFEDFDGDLTVDVMVRYGQGPVLELAHKCFKHAKKITIVAIGRGPAFNAISRSLNFANLTIFEAHLADCDFRTLTNEAFLEFLFCSSKLVEFRLHVASIRMDPKVFADCVRQRTYKTLKLSQNLRLILIKLSNRDGFVTPLLMYELLAAVSGKKNVEELNVMNFYGDSERYLFREIAGTDHLDRPLSQPVLAVFENQSNRWLTSDFERLLPTD